MAVPAGCCTNWLKGMVTVVVVPGVRTTLVLNWVPLAGKDSIPKTMVLGEVPVLTLISNWTALMLALVLWAL